jgi:hypothetical protein
MCLPLRAVDGQYNVENGMLGMRRDVVLRLCKVMGEENDTGARKIRRVCMFAIAMNEVVCWR